MSDPMIREFWQGKRQNGTTLERRSLEPICTALLTHNYNAALQSCRNALKIKPAWPLVQMLQAVTLHRQGDAKDALALASELVKDKKGKEKPSVVDPDFLLLGSWVLGQNGQEEKAATMWLNAVKQNPAAISLTEAACYHFLRISAYAHLHSVCLISQAVLYKMESDPALSTNPEIAAYKEALLQVNWFLIAASVILAGDAITKAAADTPYISSPSDSASYFPRYRIKSESATNQTPKEHTKTLLKSAYDALQRHRDGSLYTFRTHHEFHLFCRILEQRGEVEFMTAARLTEGEYPDYDNAPAKATEAAELGTARITELKRRVASPQGLEFARKNLDIELYRRETFLQYGNTTEVAALGNEMLDVLSDPEKKDTNWSTILTAVTAAHTSAQLPGPLYGRQEKEIEMWWSDEIAWWESEDEEWEKSLAMLRKTRKLLQTLGKEEKEGFSKKDRGYTLGLLKLVSMADHAAESPRLSDLVILYLERHADKNCCFEDLRPYLAMLHDLYDQAQKILSWLGEKYSLQDIDVSSLTALQASINAERVRRYLQSNYGTVERELERGHRYAKAYFAALHFGKDNLPTDLQPADDFALLAAQCYLGAWTVASESPDDDDDISDAPEHFPSSYLELAICILEYAIRRSKYRYQIRVLLIRLYRLAGAPSLAFKHYKALEPKQIQNDSLAFWALERASTFAVSPAQEKTGAVTVGSGKQTTGSTELVEATHSWYTQGDHESSVSLVRAWQSNAFTLVEDYTAFNDRLRCSFSRQSIALEMWRCRSMREPMTEEQRLSMHKFANGVVSAKGQSSDNRDESILPNYQPAMEDSVVKQTRMGAKTSASWLQYMCEIYTSFSSIQQDLNQNGTTPSEPSGLTEHEQKMHEWTKTVTPWLSGKTAKVEDAVILGFMKGCQADLAEADISLPLWHILHIAALALEAYALLDLAFLEKSANPGEFKNIKQFRQIRQDTKGCLKAISTRLKLLNEELAKKYKAKNKLASLLPLKQFEQVGDDFLLEFATELLDSRKTALAQLAATITKRIA